MKLYSILLGWIGILTKPCVSPQVFYGSRRLAGGGDGTTAAKGLKPSGQCRSPGSLKPGELLELGTMREMQMMSDSRRLVRPGAAAQWSAANTAAIKYCQEA